MEGITPISHCLVVNFYFNGWKYEIIICKELFDVCRWGIGEGVQKIDISTNTPGDKDYSEDKSGLAPVTKGIQPKSL
ncbi:MAG: hypothetical protein KAS94_03685 [Desulfobulbaceae bacterium]|nr:hypothetical protein [Desulfobulbaceae bacterium]